MTGKWYCTRDGVQGIPLQPFARQTPAGLMGTARFLCDTRPRTADAFEKANPVVTEWEYSCRPRLIHMLAGSYARILRAAVLQAITMNRMNGALSAWMTALHRERGKGQVLLTSGQRHGPGVAWWPCVLSGHLAGNASVPALVALLRKTVTMQPM